MSENIEIKKAGINDIGVLLAICSTTFIESHHKSAPKEDLDYYVALKFNLNTIREELTDKKNIYHLLYYNKIAVGYSKLLLNCESTNIEIKSIAKLERLYILSTHYDKNLGKTLYHFNVEQAKNNDQLGMWLFVWTENHRAIKFYQKNGFQIIGKHDFPISKTHSNPNYQMFLNL